MEDLEPKKLVVLTGSYRDLALSFGQQWIEDRGDSSVGKTITKEIFRTRFFYQVAGQFRQFCTQALAANPREYAQGDFMGTPFPVGVSAAILNRDIKEKYLKAYDLDVSQAEPMPSPDYNCAYFDDKRALSGFAYGTLRTGSEFAGNIPAAKGFSLIAVTHNATAPKSERQVTLIIDLKPELFALIFKKQGVIEQQEMVPKNLPIYMRELLGSTAFYDYLGFNDGPEGLFYANGRLKKYIPPSGHSDHPLAPVTCAPAMQKAAPAILDQEVKDVQKMILLSFTLDGSANSKAFLSFLKERNFPKEKIFENNNLVSLHIADTRLSLVVENGEQILKFGDVIFARAKLGDAEKWLVATFPDNYNNSDYDEKPLIVLTGSYNALREAFYPSEWLKNTGDKDDAKVLFQDIFRSSFFYQKPGDFETFGFQCLESDPIEYTQWDFTGSALPCHITSLLVKGSSTGENLRIDNAIYLNSYKISEQSDINSLSQSPTVGFGYINDQGLVSGFCYSYTGLHERGHSIIAIVHNIALPRNQREFTLILDLNLDLFGAIFQTTHQIQLQYARKKDLDTLLQEKLRSKSAFDGIKSGALLRDRQSVREILYAPGAEATSTYKDEETRVDGKIREKEKARMEKFLFYLDDTDDSRELLEFLRSRSFPENGIIQDPDHITTLAHTYLTTEVLEDGKRQLKYGNVVLAECFQQDNKWYVKNHPENYPNCHRYAEKYLSKEESEEYAKLAYEKYCGMPEKPADLQSLTETTLKAFGFADRHILFIENSVKLKLAKKIREANQVLDPTSSSGSNIASSASSKGGSEDDSGEDVASPVAAASSAAQIAVIVGPDSSAAGGEDGPGFAAVAASSASHSFGLFSLKPVARITAGAGGAVATAGGGTGLALEFLLPSALAFLHLGLAAILAISITLVVLGLVGVTLGIANAVHARQTI